MSLTLVPPPASAPVLEELLLPDLKAHLRIDGTAEDAVLVSMLGTARQYLEGRDGVARCALLTQTWDWKPDAAALPKGRDPLVIPLPPLQSVTSVKVRDANNVETTWDPVNYQVDVGDPMRCGRLVPVVGGAWPVAGLMLSPVTVRFVAGYGTTVASIPYPVRMVLLGLATDYYSNRDVAAPEPAWIDRLLKNYRPEWV